MANETAVSPLTLEDFRLEAATEPMTHSVHTEFDYLGYFRREAQCGLDIFTASKPPAPGLEPRCVCVVTELPSNHGASITNRIEEIANQLGQQLAGNTAAFFSFPKRYILVEHWHADSILDEHFNLVMFQFARDGRPSDPKWYTLEKEQITRLLGQEYNGY